MSAGVQAGSGWRPQSFMLSGRSAGVQAGSGWRPQSFMLSGRSAGVQAGSAVRLDIRYRVSFRYAEAVSESQNEVRMQPLDDEHQRVLSYSLDCDPPARVLHVLDYWGTAVDHVGVRAPHTSLELVAAASVETSPRLPPMHDPPVRDLSDPAFRSKHFEFLEPSEHVVWRQGDTVSRQAAEAAADADSVMSLVSLMVDRVRHILTYERMSTEIGVSLSELVESGSGVCQDFAHLAIGMLRSVGVPARYVSGYLFAADETVAVEAADRDEPYQQQQIAEQAGALEFAVESVARDEPGPVPKSHPGLSAAAGTVMSSEPDMVRVQTHAWIEVALPGSHWWALDPTNGGEVGERHVVIGCGRDYADVPPVRGAFTGGASAEVDAEVVIGERSVVDAVASSTARGPSRVPQRSTPVRPAGQQQQQQQ